MPHDCMRDRRSRDDAVVLANEIIFPIAANFSATKRRSSLSLSLSITDHVKLREITIFSGGKLL
jgi:hypothetical protein